MQSDIERDFRQIVAADERLIDGALAMFDTKGLRTHGGAIGFTDKRVLFICGSLPVTSVPWGFVVAVVAKRRMVGMNLFLTIRDTRPRQPPEATRRMDFVVGKVFLRQNAHVFNVMLGAPRSRWNWKRQAA